MFGYTRWLIGLIGLGGGWFGAAATVHADELSLRIKVPSGISDRGGMQKLLTKELRKNLLEQGFVIRPSAKFLLAITADVEESGGESDPPSCVVALRLQMVLMPQNREVFTASANGRSGFNRPTPMDRAKRMTLRTQSTAYAARSLIKPLRGYMEQVKEKMSSLEKGQVLGRALGKPGRRSAGGTGSASATPARPGKPLPGRPPLRKLLPAGMDNDGNKPPLAIDSEPSKP
ncbi:hypothetical protein L6R29_07715 [Myxococcota bacterium]|nr:hypothetical protein [Myxococcota bacterium]